MIKLDFSKIKQINKKVVAIAIIIILAVLIASGGIFYFGYKQGVKKSNIIVIEGVSNSATNQDKSVDFNLFWEAWKALKDKYVDSDSISNQNLINGAISGLFEATTDPYTVFMPPQEAKSFTEEISGQFGGIGIEIGIKNNQLTIIAPLKNTPAEKAGLQAGDEIFKINKLSSSGISTDEAVKNIRGSKGTKVTLLIMRQGWNEPKEFTIIRDIILIPTLDSKFLNTNGKEDENGKILYIQLFNFYEKAPALFYDAVLKSALSSPEGIILDLRNNPGGYLEASVDIAGFFLNRGDVVVGEKFRSGEQENMTTTFSIPLIKNIPTVVLINKGSASASEILAGALRDNRNIKLIGEKSFGKGSVQEVDSISNGSLMKITIAHWLTPNGTVIDKNGLVPDYEVKISEEDIKNKKDTQLEKAVEVLNSEINH
ncbi:hypothetical protein COV23_00985 [Candidatus Wolfebacteria bacterium CG10_big_fil_rev_8_21_14_0_10_31_9]|uniref:PDZ domain-containing protein n=1 Tax=Candidatus Wolfebacteria bacterium CG10_big_fil_rev_8_21_14_0_10_31_9 TaxID=1975070 RepID=A0A2H0RCQ7_9BACT|nr:MAG: hypothetical protein COV23_00985 [Candidatus Wolfebacteria bacterium CG10_big_fil_rev_8_21_14_0_10_31_9]